MSASMLCSRFLATRRVIPISRGLIRFSSTNQNDTAGANGNVPTNTNTTGKPTAGLVKDDSFEPVSTGSSNNNNPGQTNDGDVGRETQSQSTSRYMQAFNKISTIGSKETEEDETPESFASLLRNSKLMQIGDPAGRIVLGTVFEVVGDDLYIDFGGKFHCVCKTPTHRASEYTRGTKVKVKLLDLEMTSAFLGSDKHVTLLEADAILIGLHRSNQWLRSSS